MKKYLNFDEFKERRNLKENIIFFSNDIQQETPIIYWKGSTEKFFQLSKRQLEGIFEYSKSFVLQEMSEKEKEKVIKAFSFIENFSFGGNTLERGYLIHKTIFKNIKGWISSTYTI